MSAAVGATVERAVQVLHPGDVGIAEAGERLETLLGSCIAVVLTDPRRTVGAMCHIVHPAGKRGDSTAFAEPALEKLFGLLQARAIDPLQCGAFVYGGGNMFPALMHARHIGQANAEWVFDALDRHGIRILAHDVGGNRYRRLGWTVGASLPTAESVAI